MATLETGSEVVIPQESSADVVTFDVDELIGTYPRFVDRLPKLPVEPDDSMDALFVPAAREISESKIDRVAAVAKETGTRLFALVSHKAKAEAMASLLDDMSVPEWWVVMVPDEGYELPFMQFKSPDAIPDHARKDPPSNLSDKRNLGSIVGRVMGWERIMFADDDLSFSADALRRVSLMLPGRKIVGMECDTRTGFTDKDVVRHAQEALIEIHSSINYRGTRTAEPGHISGNSIAANPQVSGLVFPREIYNEDLIAFHDMHCELSAALAKGSSYRQATYDPFADPERAKTEAFGELVHDALYLPMWDGRTADLNSPAYWDNIIAERIRFIDYMLPGLDSPQKREKFGFMSEFTKRDAVQEEKIRQALLGALAMNQTFTGEMGVDYLQAWNEDKTTYRKIVPELAERQSIPDALNWLELPHLSNKA